MAKQILSRYSLCQLSYWVSDVAVLEFNQQNNPFRKEFDEHNEFLEKLQNSLDIHPTAACFDYAKYWELFNALSAIDKVRLKNIIDADQYRIAFDNPRYPYLMLIDSNQINQKEGNCSWYNQFVLMALSDNVI